MIAVGTLERLRQIVRNSFEVKPFDPKEAKAWDAAYDRYQDVRQHR
jgi:hypothetical protein